MSWTKPLLQDLHDKLSPSEFEKLIYALLDKMGFSELELKGKPGDEGVDLLASWTPELPELEVNLDFVIQVKRLDPGKTLNPRIVRELRGSISSGQWGLLVTTGKVSANTREEGLKDSSRIVSIIDGPQLAKLCGQYGVAAKPEYHFDTSFLRTDEEEEEAPEAIPSVTYPNDLTEILTSAIGEGYERLGKTPIYKSSSKTVIARWSQHYQRKDTSYWYGLTFRDIESIGKYSLTHFAYVCSDEGVVLFPLKMVSELIAEGKLNRTPKEGPLRHYHIRFYEGKGVLEMILSNGVRLNIQEFLHQTRK